MKKIKHLILSLCFLIPFLFSVPIHAEPYSYDNEYLDDEDQYNDTLSDDYYIESLDVNIDVNKDNTYDITETYLYNFVQSHHGPVRTISINDTRLYEDGNKSKTRSTVLNFNVQSDDANDNIASTSYNSGDITYMIGDENESFTGRHTYVMTYTYKMLSEDPIESFDEFYFNIIGSEWECPIENVTFTVSFPDTLSDDSINSLGFSLGKEGMSGYDTSNLFYTVDDNMITGQLNEAIYPGEALSMRILFEDGYFEFHDYSKFLYLGLFVFVLIALILLFLVKEPNYVKPISFYPPNDLDPVEIGTIYKGAVIDRDKITSLIPYLANKGFLTIKENVSGGYTFCRTEKSISEATENGKDYLNGLFGDEKYMHISDFDDTSNAKRLQSHVNYILARSAKERMFTHGSKLISNILSFIGIVALIIGFGFYDKYIALNVSVLALSIASIVLYNLIKKVLTSDGIQIAMKCIEALVTLYFMNAFLKNGISPFFDIILILATTSFYLYALAKASKRLLRRKDDALTLYEQVLGFKEFLETAKEDQLRMCVDSNPSYYYDILGYAYVFGIEEQWFKQFDDLGIIPENPDWYSGRGHVDFYNIGYAMKSINSSVPSSSSSSSSGSSGGSCSGGGSGGGGGGAW